MDYKISIIIRTYNESKHIGEVMKILSEQTYKNFEIILIDSQSTDSTIQTVEKYRDLMDLKIENIKKEEFDYSYASNYGVKKATGKLICFLSGHSVPVNDKYLEEVNKTFQNLNVGGAYGDVVALEDGSVYEKIYNELGIVKNKILGKQEKIVLEKKLHKGMLSCSNACIRKEILQRHPFAEKLGKNGGEDLEVAYRILNDGMLIAMNPKMLVKHSHGKNLKGFVKELVNWRKIYNEVIEYIKE